MVRVSPGSPSQWKATRSPLPGRDVAVEAVLADVELPAHEPLGEGQVPLEDRVPVVLPGEQVGRLAGPEALEVGLGLVVELGVGDEGVGLEPGRRRERAVLERGSPRSPGSASRHASHSSTRKPPRPVGSRRASASLTRLRAAARRGRRRGPLVPHAATLVDQLVDAVRRAAIGLARLLGGSRHPGELVDAHLAGDVLLAEPLERGAAAVVAAVGAQPVRRSAGRPAPRCGRRSRAQRRGRRAPRGASARRSHRPASSCTGTRAPTGARA